MDPVLFSLGPLQVHWYGVLIVGGAVLGALLAAQIAKWKGRNPEHIWNMLIVILLFGIIGARLYHVFSRPAGGFVGWDYYREHPIDIIAFWNGGFRGLGIYGGIVGGVLGVAVYTAWQKLNFLEWLDITIPGVLLAQAIGRWGNYVNQELYGPPTDLPWGISIDCTHRYGDFMCPPVGTVAATARFHPTFLYESLWNFVGAGLAVLIIRRLNTRLRNGDILFFYLIWYPLGRFWIELFFRPDAWTLGALPTASAISLVSVVFGVGGILFNHLVRKEPTPAPIKR
ncbi:MAG: prolipoprotein diacylglyceryl transferase [Caldilineales bacterium]|nr:prolipoprotein diacylglyceryl transferase [Caldilineales bacterium]